MRFSQLLALAWRESRTARRRLLLYMSSISLGVGALVAIDSFASNTQRSVREQKLGPVDVIGHSLGGWIADEMAAANPAQFSKMILVAPTGIRPPQGEIMDLFTVTARVYLANRGVWEAIVGAGPTCPVPADEADVERYVDAYGSLLRELTA